MGLKTENTHFATEAKGSGTPPQATTRVPGACKEGGGTASVTFIEKRVKPVKPIVKPLHKRVKPVKPRKEKEKDI